MILFSGNTSTEYGTTPKGNFFELKKGTKGSIFRSTPNPLKFLEWITASEVLFCNEVNNQLKRRNHE